MASTAVKLSLFLLLALFSSTHARDSQFFNKIPSTTNNVVVPTTTTTAATNQQEPNFLPENENSYGLYGHETGQDPPSAAATTTTTAEFKQPVNKYLPKNYNPVAYVTQPENADEGAATFAEERSFSANPDAKNHYNSGEENYYNNNNQEQEEEATAAEEFTAANDRDSGVANYYYGGGSSFNSEPHGQRSFQPQGMSDTRYLENGKYHYDLNSEKYNSNHPYETLRGARAQNEFSSRNSFGNNEFSNRNFYANNAQQNEFSSRSFNGNGAYGFNGENSEARYQNQEEFENMP